MVEAWIVVLEALELVVGGLQRLVGHHQDGHALLELDLRDLGALFIQQEGGNFDGDLHVHCRGVVLEAFFLNDPQDLESAGLRVADMA
jgi:hypothetical protein